MLLIGAKVYDLELLTSDFLVLRISQILQATAAKRLKIDQMIELYPICTFQRGVDYVELDIAGRSSTRGSVNYYQNTLGKMAIFSLCSQKYLSYGK